MPTQSTLAHVGLAMAGLLHRKDHEIVTQTCLQDRAIFKKAKFTTDQGKVSSAKKKKKKSILFRDSREEQQETAQPMDGTKYGYKGH